MNPSSHTPLPAEKNDFALSRDCRKALRVSVFFTERKVLLTFVRFLLTSEGMLCFLIKELANSCKFRNVFIVHNFKSLSKIVYGALFYIVYMFYSNF